MLKDRGRNCTRGINTNLLILIGLKTIFRPGGCMGYLDLTQQVKIILIYKTIMVRMSSLLLRLVLHTEDR